MKRAAVLVIFMFLCLSGVSNATLIDQDDGTIFDNVSGMYWYQNLNDFKDHNYSQMLSTIGSLTTGGFSWHMATEADMDSLLDNVGEQTLYGDETAPEASQITDTFTYTSTLSTTTLYQGIWESVRADKPGCHGVMQIQTRPATESYVNDDVDNYYFISGINKDLLYSFVDKYSNPNTGAWVTTGVIDDGSSSPVPEPSTILLLGSGLAGLAFYRRKRK